MYFAECVYFGRHPAVTRLDVEEAYVGNCKSDGGAISFRQTDSLGWNWFFLIANSPRPVGRH